MARGAHDVETEPGAGGAPGSAGAADSETPVVALRHLSKRFGGAQALDDVSLTILPGEVHGLLGENGSGKSTLIKVLAGFHAPEPGAELEINGKPVRLPLAPGQFRELGMSFVHQDLGLVNDLSVVENLYVGELVPGRSGGASRLRISWSRQRRRALEMLGGYGVELDPRALVGDLSETERALLAIVRAVEAIRGQLAGGADRGLLILDEPTVYLPKQGTDQLFSIIRDIVARHASVLFVSHDLDEVREITDRVTVLRDGRVQGTVETGRASETELVSMIIGRRLEKLGARAHDRTSGKVDVSVRNLSGQLVDDVSFELHEGEIVGATGLLGSGFEDIPYLLFGAKTCTAGELHADGHAHDLRSMTPSRALQAGVGLIPADRLRDGSVGSLPVGENVMLPVLERYRTPLGLRRRRMRRESGGLLEEFDVRPSDPALDYDSLSGGNQQKALLAKWMQTKPALILLHEPTQGVDIGAREQIFGMLKAVAGEGTAVICASSDYEQLASVCDRVLVLGRGRVVRELTGDDVTKERVAEQVYNSVTLAAGDSAGVTAATLRPTEETTMSKGA